MSTCTKKRVLIDCKVMIEPGANAYYVSPPFSMEKEALAKEKWAKEIEQFFRDHRHQDVNSVRVEREYSEVCSACGNGWEEMTGDNGETRCAYCGVEMEVVR